MYKKEKDDDTLVHFAKVVIGDAGVNFRVHPIFGTNGTVLCCPCCGAPVRYLPLGAILSIQSPTKVMTDNEGPFCVQCQSQIGKKLVCVAEVDYTPKKGEFPSYTGRSLWLSEDELGKCLSAFNIKNIVRSNESKAVLIPPNIFENLELEDAIKRGLPAQMKDWDRENLVQYLENRGFSVDDSDTFEELKNAVFIDLAVE